jgi:TonB family protein
VKAEVAGVVLVLIAAPAFAQEATDDWDVTESPSTETVAASLTYATGDNLIVTCRRGNLDVFLATQLPSPTARLAEMRFGDGAPELQDWYPTPNPAVVMSGQPGPNARRLRVNQTLTIIFRPEEGSTEPPHRHVLDLPAASQGIDQVLGACSQPKTDPRDDLARWDLTAMPGPHRGWDRFPRPEYPQAAAAAGITSGFASLSCIVGPLGTTDDCRVEKESDPRGGFGASALGAMRLARVRMTGEGCPAEGQLFTALIRFKVQ